MNALFLLIMIGITTPTINLDALSIVPPSKQPQLPGNSNSKKGDAKEEALDPRFNLTKPIPQGLNSTEQELANFFSQEIMPIAQDLRNIVVGKEADAAREVATRRRQQKMAEAKRKGARLPGRGGSRRATISGRGGGRWGGGSTWGRGWGGFRPSTSRFSGSSYRPSSYRPSSSFASRPSGSSSPSSSAGGFFRSSGSSSKPKSSSSSGLESTKTNDYSPKTPTRSGSHIDDKAKKIRDRLFAAKDRTLSIINSITTDAAATTAKDQFYKETLRQSDELVREFTKMQKLSDHEDLSEKAKSEFDKEIKKECDAGGKMRLFARHCIRLITYPIASNPVMAGKQTALRQTAFDGIAQLMSPSELKKMVANHDVEEEQHYRNEITHELARAKSDKTAPPGTVATLTASEKTKLETIVEKLKNIEDNFKTQLFDPTSKTPKTPLVTPTKIEALRTEIESALAP